MHMHQLLGEGSVACTGMCPWPRGSSSLPHDDKYCAHNSTHDMSSVFEMAVAKKSNIYCKDVTRRPLVLPELENQRQLTGESAFCLSTKGSLARENGAEGRTRGKARHK